MASDTAEQAPQTISKSEQRPWLFVKGDPRAGRPLGRKNDTTLAQKAFALRVLGAPGTPEFDAFVDSTRKQLLAGILPPAITALILHYAYGKPKETIEVEGNVTVEKIVREVVRLPEVIDVDAVH